jgi:glycerol kinase
LRVDGGAVENDFLCEFQADVLDATVVGPTVDETTALGAAYAAGLAVAYWADPDELRDNWRVDRRFDPSTDADLAAEYDRWTGAVERAKDWTRNPE